MCRLIILILTFFSIGQTYSQFFPAVSYENPAHYIRHLSWQVELYRPYAGIGDIIYVSNISSRYGFQKNALSLNLNFLNSDKYYRAYINPGVAILWENISFGVAPKIFFDGWHTGENFHYTDSDNPADPYFTENDKAFGLSATIGAEYKTATTSIGFLIDNLIPVKMAGDNVSRNTIEPNFSLAMNTNLLYGIMNLGIGYDLSAPSHKKLGFAIGYSKKIIGQLSLNALFEYPSSLLDVGFTIEISPKLSLNYAFEYPFGPVSKVASSHRFAISGRWSPPIKKPNLSIKISASPSKIPSNDTSLISVIITNNYTGIEQPVDFYIVADGETLLAEKTTFSKDASKTFTIKKSFTMNTNISAIVDARKKIDESDENDNLAQTSVEIVPPPEGYISILPAVLKIKRVSYTYQDRSIVPTVFFEKNSSKIDGRFNFLVDIVTQRLKANPDVNLEIIGFLAPDEENYEIANERSIEVKNSILSKSPELAKQLEIISPEDVKKLRVPQLGLKQGDTTLLLEENRRVEFFAELSVQIDTTVPYDSFPNLDWQQISKILSDNEDVVLVVSADNSSNDEQQAFTKALRVKEYIVKILGRQFENKVFASIARMESKSNSIRIFLSADGVLYKPFIITASREISPKSLANAEILVSIKGEIANWQIDAINTQTHEFISTITSGKGTPPQQQKIKWDFSTPDGDVIPLGRNVAVRLVVNDIFGRVDTSYAQDTVKAIIEESETREEKMLLVQFEFDSPSAQSRYLEDRLELIARKLIEIILQSKNSTITIEGHTDIIGLKQRNINLSQERANAILQHIKIAMANIINITDEKLDRWLKDHNSKITAVGLSDTKPYEIDIWRGGNLTKMLLGNNTQPEGRTINRRVIVVVSAEK